MTEKAETRSYTKGDLSVFWQPALCTHCEECYYVLPAVFNPNRRPWINLNLASDDEIRNQVAQCPSGAISIVEPRQ